MRALVVVVVLATLAAACGPTGPEPATPGPAAPVVAARPPVVTPEPPDADPALKRDDEYDARYPFPRNPTRGAALVAGRRAWLETQFGADAKRFPPGPPRADAVGRAVAAHIEGVANPSARDTDTITRRKEALNLARDTGCELPYILYDYYRDVWAGRSTPNWKATYAARFEADGYSPLRRLHAHWLAAAQAAEKADRPATDEQLAPFWRAVADLCRDTDRAASEQVLQAAVTAVTTTTLGPNLAKRYKRVDAALATAGAGDWLRKVVEGRYLIAWAWEARGNDFEPKSADGARKHAERLTAAEERLAAAHELAPDRPEPATAMISVCMGLGHDRAEMERWFVRAVTADPDALAAVNSKLLYLDPRWHGGRDEALAFARQCLRVSTPDDRLNEYLLVAYRTLAIYDTKVWTLPGVWADLRACYEPLLAARPDDRWARTRFLRICLQFKQYEAAEQHRAFLGGRLWPNEFSPDEQQDLMNDLDDWVARKKK